MEWPARLLKLRSNAGDHLGTCDLSKQYPDLLESGDIDLSYDIAWSMYCLNKINEAEFIAEKMLKKPNLLPEERAKMLKVTAAIKVSQGNYRESERIFAEVCSLTRKTNRKSLFARALHNHAVVLRGLGRYDEMISELKEAVDVYTELGDGRSRAESLLLIGQQLIELGEYEQAENLLIEVRSFLEKIDHSAFHFFCDAVLSYLYLEWDPPYGGTLAAKYAYDALNHAHRAGSQSDILQGLIGAGMAETRQGQPLRALELAQTALERARTAARPFLIAGALFAQAYALKALGRRDQALAAFRESAALSEQMGRQFDVHKSGLELDRLTNNPESARKRMTWFEERGLMGNVNLARRYFPELVERSQAQTIGSFETRSAGRLEVLGSMQLVQDGKVEPIRGQKRKRLLALLAEARLAGRAEMPTLRLTEALYPEVPDGEAADTLKQLIHKTRSSFGQAMLQTTVGGYALGVGTDAEAFLSGGDTRLWRGAFLEGTEGDRDEIVQEAVYRALSSRSQSLLDSNPREVVRLGRILLEAEPYDRDLLSLMLEAMRKDGNHRSLSRLYLEARTRFLEVGEVLPEAWTAFLGA